MALLPANLDYTDKDFTALRERLINLIRTVFPDWTDVDVANFGNVMLECFAFVGDVLTNYQDNQSRESRLIEALIRRNVIALAAHLGYTPRTAAPATADVLFALDSTPANDVTIPAGTVVRTRDVTGAIDFQLLLDLVIAAGSDPPQAFGTVENSTTILGETFQSTGLANQRVQLARTPYIDDTAVVSAANGAFTQVSNFLSSTSADRHYVVTIDETDRARLTFGNGVNGQVPTGAISVAYKIGGGLAGNVEANNITTIVGQFTDALSNPVRVSVTNPGKASGGANRETVAQIKQNAPASVRVSDRTVALEDYTIHAEELSSVARALMVTSDQLPGLPENRGRLYIVPVGGGLPSAALKAQVLAAVTVDKPKTITFQVSVRDPQYLTVDITCTVFFTTEADPQNVANLIRTRLADFFRIQNTDGTKNTQIGFGLDYVTDTITTTPPEIPLSDVQNVVRDTTGVRKLGDRAVDFTLNEVHADLLIGAIEFPQLGNVVIMNGATGQLVT